MKTLAAVERLCEVSACAASSLFDKAPGSTVSQKWKRAGCSGDEDGGEEREEVLL